MKKSIKVLIIVLCLIIVGLVTFIIVDKVINNKSEENTVTNSVDNNENESNKNESNKNELSNAVDNNNVTYDNNISNKNVVEKNNNTVNKNNSEEPSENSANNEVDGDLGEFGIIANNAIAKCLIDENWLNNNISSSSAQRKFIKIKNINDSPAYIIDSNLNGSHSIALVFYMGNKVVVKKKVVSNDYQSISVDTKANILVLGDFRKYLNVGESEYKVSLNFINENGFTEYGCSGEVPSLNGEIISFGTFKNRTQSIEEKTIDIDLNKNNIEKYVQ